MLDVWWKELSSSLVGRRALACPFQIWGKYWHLTVTIGVRVFKEAGIASRLVTEQGKQLALNRERIASLYGCEGIRLVLYAVHRVHKCQHNFLHLQVVDIIKKSPYICTVLSKFQF